MPVYIYMWMRMCSCSRWMMSFKNRIGSWRRPTGPQPTDLLYPPASPSTYPSSSSPGWSIYSSSSSTSTQDKYRPLSPWNPGPGDVDGGLGPRALNLFNSTFRPGTPSSGSSREEEQDELSSSDSTPYFPSSFSSSSFHERRPDHAENEGGLFEDFQPRTHFNLDRSITWFPPHMTKATLAIDKCYKHIDCLLEVRDARAPLTCSSSFLTSKLPSSVQRLVILNKADLVPRRDALRARSLIEDAGIPCLLTCAPQLKKVSTITDFAVKSIRPRFKTVGIWMMLAGLPNTGKSSLLNAMKKIAINASRFGRLDNKIVEGVKRTKAKEGKAAGVTKEVSVFQISNRPRLYCYDTPGIMLPKMKDLETNLKLAALGCVNDHKAGEMYVADYILYHLNRMRRFDYVRVLGLPGPSNDIQEVAGHIFDAAYAPKTNKRRVPPSPDLLSGCRLFTELFRGGKFGFYCLDSLPAPDWADLLHERRGEGPLGGTTCG
ncbi:gtp binding protein 7 isoform 2 family protein [Cystoisospora suis]|uniref:Gtp binding protein 7 isoform 2 family protein n=1 Tax=Cystoisospora suis TaxID=483139 RepID=A0A2C6KBJ1_9APIC|nr:gtp binding protein 7 isoform 2 family protein [Cystoisospora suis]